MYKLRKNKIMKTLKQLKVEHEKIRKKLQKIDEQIEGVNLKKELPILKKKYEGKYWKYDNGTDSKTRWWLYSFCRKIVSQTQGLFDCFEHTNTIYERKYNFSYNQEYYFHLCEIEITKEEYEKAFNDILKEVNKINPNK